MVESKRGSLPPLQERTVQEEVEEEEEEEEEVFVPVTESARGCAASPGPASCCCDATSRHACSQSAQSSVQGRLTAWALG
jgi:hypothetical protein